MLCKKIYDDDGSCIFSNIYIAILLSLHSGYKGCPDPGKENLWVQSRLSCSVGWLAAGQAGLARENLWGSENPRTSSGFFVCPSHLLAIEHSTVLCPHP